jgi:hypothetical protein
MAKLEQEMFAVVNRNHECKSLAERLNAISAKRKLKRSIFRCRRGK